MTMQIGTKPPPIIGINRGLLRMCLIPRIMSLQQMKQKILVIGSITVVNNNFAAGIWLCAIAAKNSEPLSTYWIILDAFIGILTMLSSTWVENYSFLLLGFIFAFFRSKIPKKRL